MKNNEQGGILIDILIAMGILLVISTLAMKAKINAKIIDDRVFAKSSSEFQLESFTQKVGSFAIQKIPNLCNNQLTLGTTFDIGGSKATISKIAQIPPGSGEMASLQKRCGQAKASSSGQFYFCVEIEPNTSIHANSFLGAKSNVAELAIRLVDRWQQPISCSQYASNPSASNVGIQIYYRQYWTPENKGQTTHQKSGFYYAVQ